MSEPVYTYSFSHEFDDGPSGPARSYWNITCHGLHVGTICTHHRSAAPTAHLYPSDVCTMLEAARQAGRADKAREIRDALDCKPR